MLRHSSDKPHWDEIYVDFRRVGAREDEPLQNGWCRFIRE
jgi:hypothetical protein